MTRTQKRAHAEEVRAEHMYNSVMFWSVMFFAGWGVARCAILTVEAVCRWWGL